MTTEPRLVPAYHGRGRVDLEAMLTDWGDGWRGSPQISLNADQWVDDPTKYRDGEPGRVYGPARVHLSVAPDGGRTLTVRED